MSEIADRYRRLAADFTAEVTAVPPTDDRWSNPSPCADWKARDVVAHMVDTHHIFFGLIGHDVAPGPSVDDDGDDGDDAYGGPLGAWAYVRDAMQAALDDPAVAGTEFDGMFGRTRWDAAVDRFINGDVMVHRWDLGQALGTDPQLDIDDVRRMMAGLDGLPEEAMRAPGTFGPAIEPPPGATEQEQFLAFTGRNPR